MFGDYYTPDLLSGSPNTNMIGNQIDFYLHSSEVRTGAALVVALAALLLVLMLYYIVYTARATREA
jgi:spermidine/putrescine transport system permease protein